MTQLNIIQTLTSIVKEFPVNLRSYSGRGMYGNYCAALSGSREDCMDVIKHTIVSLKDNYDFEEIVECLLSFRQDQLGLDIVMYWPDLEFVTYTPEIEEQC